MERKNWLKGLILAILSCFILGAVACKASTDGYNPFLKGAQETLEIGDSILVEDLIGRVEDGTYTLTVQCGEEIEDITGRVTWQPVEIGMYVFTYTIHEGDYKGTYIHNINVVSAKHIQVDYELAPINVLYEREMVFADFFEQLNIAVPSHASGWKPIMLSVRVDDTLITFEETQTSYFINSLSEHYFKYVIRTLDGRERELMAIANAVYCFDESEIWLNREANGKYTIAEANVEMVKINGTTCPASDVQITEAGVVFEERILHDKYAGVNNVSLITKSGKEVRKILNVYAEGFNLENGIPDDIFIFWEMQTKSACKIDTYNGSKALKMWGSHKWQQFAISREYLDFVFEDGSIDKFVFDFTVNFESTTGATTILLSSSSLGVAFSCAQGQTTTIVITRGQYETWLNKNPENGNAVVFGFQNQVENTGTVLLEWYIDNLQGREIYFDGTFETMTDVDLTWGVAYGRTKSVNVVEDTTDETNKVLKVVTADFTGSSPVISLTVNDSFVEQMEVGKLLSYRVHSEAINNVSSMVSCVGSILSCELTSASGIRYFTVPMDSSWTTVSIVLTEEVVARFKETKQIYLGIDSRPTDKTQPRSATYCFDDFTVDWAPLTTDFNAKTILVDHSGTPFIKPTYTSTNTTANQSASMVEGYSGSTTNYWQKTAWIDKSGVTGEDGDYAYLLQFQHRSHTFDVFGYSVDFLDEIFADSLVDALTWKLKTNSDADTIFTNVAEITAAWQANYTANTWNTITLTRAQYEAIKEQNVEWLTVSFKNSTGQNGEMWTNHLTVWHDDVELVFADKE